MGLTAHQIFSPAIMKEVKEMTILSLIIVALMALAYVSEAKEWQDEA